MKQAYYHIVEQYGEQAAFLFERRCHAVNEPHYFLDNIRELDRRIDAHIDALVLSGEEGAGACESLLETSEPGEIFTTVCTALLSVNGSLLQSALEQIPSHPEALDGLIGALHWIPLSTAKQALDICSRSDKQCLQAAAVCASGARRTNVDQRLLLSLIESGNPGVQWRALRIIGEHGQIDLRERLADFIASVDPLCAFHAARSAVLLGIDSAREKLFSLSSDLTSGLSDNAASCSVRGQNFTGAKQTWERFLNNPATIRPGLIALGAAGFSDNVEILLDYMGDSRYTKVCGEMVSMITGVDFVSAGLDTQRPSDYKQPVTDNPDDNEVALHADEFLPWPDVQKVRGWWIQNRSSFQPGMRYLAGKIIDNQSLLQVLRFAPQRQRHAAAIELVLGNGTPVLFNTRAPSEEQLKLLDL